MVVTFNEFKYFTKITSLSTSEYNGWRFIEVDFRNITTITASTLNNDYLSLFNMPNLTRFTASTQGFAMGIGNFFNARATTSKAYFLPKLELWNPNFRFMWYGRGEVRWIVLGTDNGGKIVTVGGTDATKNFKTGPRGIFVPDALVNDYKTDSYWSKWESYIHGISEFRTLVTDVTGEELPTYPPV